MILGNLGEDFMDFKRFFFVFFYLFVGVIIVVLSKEYGLFVVLIIIDLEF